MTCIDHAQRGKVGARPSGWPISAAMVAGTQQAESTGGARDVAQPRPRFEARGARNAGARLQGGQRLVVQAAHVEQGQRGQHVVVLPQIVGMDRVVPIPQQRTLLQDCTPGCPRCAGGVDDQQVIFVVAGCPRLSLVAPVAQRHAKGAGLHFERSVAVDAPRCAIAQDGRVLGRRQAPVQGHQDCTSRPPRTQREHVPDGCSQPLNALAPADAERPRSLLDTLPETARRTMRVPGSAAPPCPRVLRPVLDDAREVQSSASPLS